MSHVYRAYHAIRNLTNKKGLPTNAVYGFTNMLRKLMVEEKPDYLGVAVDLPGPTVRHEQYEGYKATRRPTPEDLIAQIPYVRRVCEVLRVPVLSYEKYEADDVIGTLSRKAEEAGLEVVIVTIDKDLFQLVNNRITVLDTRTMTRFDSSKVEDKLGVLPPNVVDVLSLVGDTSDNIPGAPGIGEKGACQLIREFGDLDGLLAARDQVSRKTYRESLQQNEALILKSRELATIYQDLPLELALDELEVSAPDEEAARELFAELEFTTLLDEFVPTGVAEEPAVTVVDSRQKLGELATRIEGKSASLAMFWSVQGNVKKELQAISVSDESDESWYVAADLLREAPSQVAKLLGGAQQWFVHDLKPLYLFGRRHGWELKENFRDTMLMAYLVSPNQKDFSLGKLALEYLQIKLGKNGAKEGELFGEELMTSVCQRAQITWRLSHFLVAELSDKKLTSLLDDIEIPLVRVLERMEERGIKLDGALLERMSGDMEAEISRLTGQIHGIAGSEFNINSPRQLSDVLFDKLNLPVAKKTRKAGHYATGVEVLQELAGSYDIARLILDYREYSKLKSTYLDALPKLVSPETGRIHTSYNQMVAATGRLSSSNPNLQNIPVKSELGRGIRRAFVAEPGYQILSADYSQIELRVMAHLARDPVLMEAFLKEEDIHQRTAQEVFGADLEMSPQARRRRAKVINFGIMYGLSAFGLSKSLKIDRKSAQQFIDSYFTRYKGVKTWIDRTLEEVYDKGYVTTLFGRIRPIPEIRSKNASLRSFGERTAINAPIQGTAADLIKKAMVAIDGDIEKQHLKSKLLLQVHDELVLEVEETETEQVTTLVKEHMEGVARLEVPLRVDMGMGPSWFDAK